MTQPLSRRTLLAGLAALPATLTGSRSLAESAGGCDAEFENTQASANRQTGTTLVILGSGAGPSPMLPGRTRHMASNVMVSNGAAYVLDCGLGVTNQLARSGVSFTAVRSIFITHHHPDHNIEYGPLLLLGWSQGMPNPVRAFGPPPLKQMTADFLRAYQQTIDLWAQDFNARALLPPQVSEISTPGLVAEDENVRVTASVVQHPPVRPALAYRFDFHDRSIVFSGDTAPTEKVAKLAEGADVLVHEAMYTPALEKFLRDRIAQGARTQYSDFMAHMKAVHSPVEEVGRIAQEAGVKTLVLTHLTPSVEDISDETWRTIAAQRFKGKIVVARDLMHL